MLAEEFELLDLLPSFDLHERLGHTSSSIAESLELVDWPCLEFSNTILKDVLFGKYRAKGKLWLFEVSSESADSSTFSPVKSEKPKLAISVELRIEGNEKASVGANEILRLPGDSSFVCVTEKDSEAWYFGFVFERGRDV